MKHAQIRYGAQHQVFFLATLALFSEKLTVRPLDPWFFSPYFNFAYDNDLNSGRNKQDPGLELAELMLAEYKNNGYIEYAKINGLFEITEIDTAKALKDLVLYLNQWQQNELLSISASKPPDITHQQSLLLNAIKRVHAQQNKPRISMSDVYGAPSEYAYEPPFWELVLSYQLLDKKIEILEMDYDRRGNGLYDNGAQPYVEIDIIDDELLKSTSPIVPTDIVAAQSVHDTIPQRAWVIMPERHVLIELGDGSNYKITQKEKGLRTDLAPYSLIKYLIDKPGYEVTIEHARTKIDGCDRIKKLSETIRQCGFDEAKKNMFFEICTDKKVKLRKEVYLSLADVAQLKQ